MKNCTRNTFPSQKAKDTSPPEHFWKSSPDVEKVHGVAVRNTFPGQKLKAHHSRRTFGSRAVEKVHAVVARSTSPSQNAKRTPCPEHFWKLRCSKSARHCGAKHIVKSKWERNPHARTTFGGSDVEVRTVVARSTFRSQKKAQHVRTTFGRSTAPHYATTSSSSSSSRL